MTMMPTIDLLHSLPSVCVSCKITTQDFFGKDFATVQVVVVREVEKKMLHFYYSKSSRAQDYFEMSTMLKINSITALGKSFF